MIEIEKDILKIYLNEKYISHKKVDDIKSISICEERYYEDMVSKESIYYPIIENNGFIDLLMIKPIWSGWSLVGHRGLSSSKYTGTWEYRDARSNYRFVLDSYQKWLIEFRDRKLNKILSIK